MAMLISDIQWCRCPRLQLFKAASKHLSWAYALGLVQSVEMCGTNFPTAAFCQLPSLHILFGFVKLIHAARLF